MWDKILEYAWKIGGPVAVVVFAVALFLFFPIKHTDESAPVFERVTCSNRLGSLPVSDCVEGSGLERAFLGAAFAALFVGALVALIAAGSQRRRAAFGIPDEE